MKPKYIVLSVGLIALICLSAVTQIDWPTGIKRMPVYDVRSYGATGNGTTNDTTSIRSAITAATSACGTVYFPVGSFLVTPDLVTVPVCVNIEGAGDSVSTILASANGSVLVALSASAGSASISKIGFSANSHSIDDILTVAAVTHSKFSDIRILGTNTGRNGLTQGGTVAYNLFTNILIKEVTGHGFSSATDTSAENSYSHIKIYQFTSGTMTAGWYVSRTTTTDIGAYYMNDIRVNALPPGAITTGFVFTSSAGSVTGVFAFLNACVADGVGYGIHFNKTATATVVGSWFFGGVGGAGVRISNASQNLNFSGNLTASALPAAAAAFRFDGTASTGIQIFGTPTDPNQTTHYFDLATTPADLVYAGNYIGSIPLVKVGQEAALLAASVNYPTYTNGLRVNTSTAGSQNSEFNLYDPVNANSRTMRNNTGTLEFLNDAHTTVVAAITDAGRLVATTSVNPGSKTYATLPGSPVNGDIIYCSDCVIASPCANSGTGALAKRLNGAWICN